MYKFQRAAVATADELVDLWVKTFEQAYEGVHSPENIHAYCSRNFTNQAALKVLNDDWSACCIASKKGQAVGYYVVSHHPCPVPLEGLSSELKQLYILSSEYGTGLGKSLFGQACETARNAGSTWLWLCVSDINYRAQAFYKKQDFKPVGKGPVFEVGTDRLSSTVMVCSL
ncbi:GNAT family N-acetyltransferase [Fulvivirgaceae bacterium BMA12]|uniref:GNAT family N-acetyltransferase n=1 Tax=Agaribacillus aureus TaxID=3051825 RepID=A0ABT8L0R8_9BACT|nr:GNAT family N-acetyltransferase [Fulvivirgaceae bacterium BMA12]